MNHPVAIFGGTFDPIHNGHLGLAHAVIDAGQANRVIFVPARIPPHKRGRKISPGAVRLELVRLATADNAAMDVSDWELNRQEVSYTWHTAEHFAATYGNNLRILIGMDSLADLHTWYRGADLVETYRFIIYRRPDSPPPNLTDLANRFGSDAAYRLLSAVVDGPAFQISSTEVRQRVADGKDVATLLPPAVLTYVTANQLYANKAKN